MPQLELSREQEAVLRDAVISANAPGVILHDFQVMLDFVAENRPQLTESQRLPLKVLKPLHGRLSRQIEHGLARPQQKSFPHINGLYLLLRASGLTLVEIVAGKPRLTVDPIAAASWAGLNATERYVVLLESWLLRGDAEIIGERAGRFEYNNPLRLWADFFEGLRLQDWGGYDDWTERVRYWPALHNLALMELFGAVTVKDAPAQPKKGWQIDDVTSTAWGEALLTLIFSKMTQDWGLWTQLAEPQNIMPGEFLPFVRPYQPACQHTLQLPEAAFQDGTYVFKVALSANLWREIFLQATSTLEDLSNAILRAYDFDHDHLYRFLYQTRFGIKAAALHPYMDDGPSTDEVRIGDMPLQPGSPMTYNYDFGDNWLFDVVLERIDPPDSSAERYRIGERHGESPEQYHRW